MPFTKDEFEQMRAELKAELIKELEEGGIKRKRQVVPTHIQEVHEKYSEQLCAKYGDWEGDKIWNHLRCLVKLHLGHRYVWNMTQEESVQAAEIMERIFEVLGVYSGDGAELKQEQNPYPTRYETVILEALEREQRKKGIGSFFRKGK